MATSRTLGYIFSTGAIGADGSAFQQLVTIDGPTQGPVMHSCLGRQGLYIMSAVQEEGEFSFGIGYKVHVLPTPGGETDRRYAKAQKMKYRWKSKKFVLNAKANMTAAKVVFGGKCLRLHLYVDGCLKFSQTIRTCTPFRLPDQLIGTVWEVELIGQARVHEVHIASTVEELTDGGSSE